MAVASAYRTTKIRSIWRRLADASYRATYASAAIGNALSAQIYLMRIERGWTQAQIAERADMKQSRISALEASSHDVSLNTLKRLATAFDVALVVRFVPFSDLVRDVADNRASRMVVSFDEDSAPISGSDFKLKHYL